VDIISTLIRLKMEIESVKRTTIKMTITGASEAHVLAAEIADAGIGVIVNPSRPFPVKWQDRRM
jgi:ribosomal protein S5